MLEDYQSHFVDYFFGSKDDNQFQILNNRLKNHNPKEEGFKYIIHILSRAINNPGDIENHLKDSKSVTLFVGGVYNDQIV